MADINLTDDTLEGLSQEYQDAETPELDDSEFSQQMTADDVPEIDPQAAALIASMFQSVLSPVFARMGASAVTDQEAGAVGMAGAGVARFYMGATDPKTAAFITLGVTVTGVFAGKAMEARMNKAKQVNEVEPSNFAAGFTQEPGDVAYTQSPMSGGDRGGS